MRKQVYNDIKTQIKTVAEVNRVQLFNRQFELITKESPMNFGETAHKCNVLVEFDQINWIPEGKRIVKGEATIRIHIGFGELADDPEDLLDIVQKIHTALQGHATTEFTALSRIEEFQDTDHDNLFVWQMDYETTITDCDANPDLVLVEIAAPIGLELEKVLDVDDEKIRSGDGVE